MNEDKRQQDSQYDAHPVFKEVSQETNKKSLSFSEIVRQAFSLVFALQKGSGLKRATDLLETNPMSVVLAGIVAMIIFFSICFTASQLAIYFLTA